MTCSIMTVSFHISTGIADFSTNRQTVTFVAGDAATKTVDIGLRDDDINEVEQYFVMLLEIVTAIDPDRVNLQGTRNASLGRILDNDRKRDKYFAKCIMCNRKLENI